MKLDGIYEESLWASVNNNGFEASEDRSVLAARLKITLNVETVFCYEQKMAKTHTSKLKHKTTLTRFWREDGDNW